MWGGIVFGLGPAFLFPSETNELLGSGKWGAGPTAVLLKKVGGWSVGALVNHIWSLPVTTTVPTSPTPSFTFCLLRHENEDHVDLEFGIQLRLEREKVDGTHEFYGQPTGTVWEVANQLAGRRSYYPVSPRGGPDWGLRFTVTPLFPLSRSEAPSVSPFE